MTERLQVIRIEGPSHLDLSTYVLVNDLVGVDGLEPLKKLLKRRAERRARLRRTRRPDLIDERLAVQSDLIDPLHQSLGAVPGRDRAEDIWIVLNDARTSCAAR